jgi:hypothetical protein
VREDQQESARPLLRLVRHSRSASTSLSSAPPCGLLFVERCSTKECYRQPPPSKKWKRLQASEHDFI